MAFGAILIGLALLILAVFWITKPFFTPTPLRPSAARRGIPRPYGRGREALLALRELDFDFRTGKVTEEDYTTLRAGLLAEAAAAFEEPAHVQAGLDAEIEAAVLAQRQQVAPVQMCQHCGRAARPGDRFCTGCGVRLEGLCPTCGQPTRPTDRFCATCGVSLERHQPAGLTTSEAAL